MEQVKSLECFHLRLESESSITSEGDTESVLSLQGKETEFVEDTPDTDTKSEYSSDGDVYEVEYEVATSSGGEDFLKEESSSGSDDMLMSAAIAAAICDSSMEAWITDVEDSDTSIDEIGLGRTDFLTCIQCKSPNDNPRFSYCEKCFQRCWQCKMRKNFSGFPLCSNCFKARKTLFPPRPRKFRPRKKTVEVNVKVKEPAVALANLQSCLSGLSHDSGVGSSQELCKLNVDEIVVPKHITDSLNSFKRKRKISGGSDSLLSDSDVEPIKRKRSNENENNRKGTKRSNDEDREECDRKKSKIDVEITKERVIVVGECSKGILNSSGGIGNVPVFNGTKWDDSQKKSDDADDVKSLEDKEKNSHLSESKELCISCNVQPKNSIFLHGKTGHMCCCYRCAVRTWHTLKSCPMCKMKVQNVVKVFT